MMLYLSRLLEILGFSDALIKLELDLYKLDSKILQLKLLVGFFSLP